MTRIATTAALLVAGCAPDAPVWLGPEAEPEDVPVVFELRNVDDACYEMRLDVDGVRVLAGTVGDIDDEHCWWSARVGGALAPGPHRFVLSGDREAVADLEITPGATVLVEYAAPFTNLSVFGDRVPLCR